jgi:hypothetical protein
MSRKNRPKSRAQLPKSFKARHELPSWLNQTVVRCITGKTGFLTQAAAEARLERHEGSNRHASLRRVYRCQHCDSFHLTSQESRP